MIFSEILKETFGENPPLGNKRHPIIIVDDREKNEVPKILRDMCAIVIIVHLDSGDYIVSNNLGIELKVDRDFINSTFGDVDHNLFDQMFKLADYFKYPNLVTSGLRFEKEIKNDDANIKGSLRYFDTHYSTNHFDNEKEAAEFIFDIAVSQQKTNKRGKSRSVKKRFNLKQRREYFIQGLSQIGSVMSKTIMEKYSIEEFISLILSTELLLTKSGNPKTPKGGYLGVKGIGYKKLKEWKETIQSS